MNNKIKTLKDLKSSGYSSLDIKDEMIKNLKINLSKVNQLLKEFMATKIL
jgi:hypothetical protein